MATTSLQFPSDHHHHPSILQENHQSKQSQQAMNHQTAVTGRRRGKNVQKKKKLPQRGMGVEQLERLRVQDQIKNMSNTIHGGHHHQYYSNSNNFPNFTTTLSSFTGVKATVTAAAVADPGIYSNSILNSSPVLQFPKTCVSPNNFFMQQKVVNTGLIGSSTTSTVSTGPAHVAFGDQLMLSSSHNHQFQSHLYKFATEKSKEFSSSMPNLFSSNNNSSCFSDRCRSCNKKKRMINGDEMSIHMEDMIREKEDFGTKPLLQYPYSIQKGVEIVAIHRKGGSSLFSSEEGGAVVMEYDFFPEKNGSRSTNNTSCFGKMMMSTTYNSPESSSVAAAVGNINGEGSSVTTISWADTATPTSSIDLSLKLSC